MTSFPPPVAAWAQPDDPHLPLVVLLHGRGSNEQEILTLAPHLPGGVSYVALRAPLDENRGFAWFTNRGIGRPLPESLAATIAWGRRWLDDVAPDDRPVILVGFSGGAAYAGGLVLDDPPRFAGTAVLYGTLPFDAGVPTDPARLRGAEVLALQGLEDSVIPSELLARTREYLAGESDASATIVELPGGHGISDEALTRLQGWLEQRIQSISSGA